MSDKKEFIVIKDGLFLTEKNLLSKKLSDAALFDLDEANNMTMSGFSQNYFYREHFIKFYKGGEYE